MQKQIQETQLVQPHIPHLAMKHGLQTLGLEHFIIISSDHMSQCCQSMFLLARHKCSHPELSLLWLTFDNVAFHSSSQARFQNTVRCIFSDGGALVGKGNSGTICEPQCVCEGQMEVMVWVITRVAFVVVFCFFQWNFWDYNTMSSGVIGPYL